VSSKMVMFSQNQYDIGLFEAGYSAVHYFHETVQMKVICIIQ